MMARSPCTRLYVWSPVTSTSQSTKLRRSTLFPLIDVVLADWLSSSDIGITGAYSRAGRHRIIDTLKEMCLWPIVALSAE